MHPQNRFWKIMSAVCGLDLINCSHEEKQSALLKNRIALYDAVCECDIEGSSDSSVKNIKPADIKTLIAGADIKKILCNGTLSFSLTRQNNPALAVPIIKMPSTSPANAKTAYAELERMWLGELLLI
jgi:hypoxanthine-DNA glycosylase